MNDRTAAVQAIRHFNRYYTNKLGLLARTRFDTKLSLTEARVILEVGRRGEHTQSGLRADLKVDMGYLSRVVRRLSGQGLLASRADPRDGRILVLELTASGRSKLQEINVASESRTRDLIGSLSEEDLCALVGHLKTAETILEGRSARSPGIEPATSAADIATARVLMREYAASLGVDLSFQGFEKELAALPGKYAPPAGALLLARVPAGRGSEAAGCVALRKLSAGVCEMKRLFVRPEYRGLGIGRLLATRVVEEARALGYRTMRLDTLDRLESAVALYRQMGFKRIPPYCRNPLPGAMFWEKDLRRSRVRARGQGGRS